MIFDIIALVFVLIVTFVMMKKGGIKAVVSLIGLVLSVVIASSVYPVLSETVYKTDIPVTIEKTISETLSEGYDNISWEAVDAMPVFIRNAVRTDVDSRADDMVLTLSEAVTEVVINIMLFILLVIVTKLILAVLVKMLDLVAKLPVIKQFNALTGALCGLGMSLVIVWLVVALLGVAGAANPTAARAIEGSYTVEIMSNITPF